MLMSCAMGLYFRVGGDWKQFAMLFLAPDLSFAGYLVGPRVGAAAYNAMHSTIAPLGSGRWLALRSIPHLALTIALIWLAHIGFDRALGYGLKYGDGFGFTHLGRIGRTREGELDVHRTLRPCVRRQGRSRSDCRCGCCSSPCSGSMSVWSALVMLNVEKLRIVKGFTEGSSLDLYYMPYTHGLIGALALSAGTRRGRRAVLSRAARRRPARSSPARCSRTGCSISSSTCRTCRLLGDSYKVGFGLWRHVWISFPLEIAILVAGAARSMPRAVPSRDAAWRCRAVALRGRHGGDRDLCRLRTRPCFTRRRGPDGADRLPGARRPGRSWSIGRGELSGRDPSCRRIRVR